LVGKFVGFKFLLHSKFINFQNSTVTSTNRVFL